MTSSLRTFDLLGTPLLATDYEQLIAQCHNLARTDGVSAIDFTNTHIVTMRRRDRHFRELTSNVDYFVPDGMPLIWCLNSRGAALRDRVYGPTFMRRCIEASPTPWTHYFLGGSEECVQKLKDHLQNAVPELRVLGTHNGYFSPNDEPEILQEINQLSPDFIWVGLGTPKQQDWIHRYRNRIDRGVLLAVGFAFDVNAGMKADAPAWMQRAGLTWAFRIFSEPRRLLTRYLRHNSLFLYYLAHDALRRRPHSS